MIIVVNELVLKGLAEDDPDNCHKENRDNDRNDPFTGSARRGPPGCAATRSFFPPDRIWHEKEIIAHLINTKCFERSFPAIWQIREGHFLISGDPFRLSLEYLFRAVPGKIRPVQVRA